MKHGLKFRKLSRTSSHRWALLRNLVSALLHHESIKTTLPKAKETARLAEKIITLGKRGTDPAYRSAMAFLMPSHSYPSTSIHNGPTPPPLPSGYPDKPGSSSSASSSRPHSSSSPTAEFDPETFRPPTTLLPKLFSTLSTRYAARPGGYTRIHKFGRRPGDNAPHAILELVDGPKDLKFEMVARAIGREAAVLAAERGVEGVGEGWDDLRESTQMGRSKVLKYRGAEGERVLAQRAREWTDRVVAEERAGAGHRRKREEVESKPRSEAARTAQPYVGRPYRSGERMSGMDIASTGLGLARGELGKKQRENNPDQTPAFIGERQRLLASIA